MTGVKRGHRITKGIFGMATGSQRFFHDCCKGHRAMQSPKIICCVHRITEDLEMQSRNDSQIKTVTKVNKCGSDHSAP